MLFKQKKSKNWSYKFVWNGQLIRESTRQANRRTAEQIESAKKTQLAKAEVGLKDPVTVPTLQDFATEQFLPFAERHFGSRRKTLGFYENGVKNLLAHKPLARLPLDAITTGNIATFAAGRRAAGLAIASVNRELQVLRRMFRLAQEWGKVDKLLAKVSMVPKENHRERVLTGDEEKRYLEAATSIGEGIEEAHQRALEGIRAKQRGEQPIKPRDPFLLRDVFSILLDCALRPEECFRLRWEQVRDGAIHVLHGKTESARRVIPLSERAAAAIERRRGSSGCAWVFAAPTESGHIEKSSLKKQHLRAVKESKVPAFVLYELRHTCITRWAEHMDPYTLAYLAGHSDFAMTKRYVHPQKETIRKAMEKARGGHAFGHTTSKKAPESTSEAVHKS